MAVDKEQMSDEQQLLSAPYTFKWRGRDLKLGALEEQHVAELVALCKSAALVEFEELQQLRYPPPLSSEQEMRRQADEEKFETRMTTGFYRFGGKGMHQWRQTLPGQRSMIAVMLAAGGTAIDSADIPPLLKEGGNVLGRIIGAILWDAEFPNVPRPEEMNPTPLASR